MDDPYLEPPFSESSSSNGTSNIALFVGLIVVAAIIIAIFMLRKKSTDSVALPPPPAPRVAAPPPSGPETLLVPDASLIPGPNKDAIQRQMGPPAPSPYKSYFGKQNQFADYKSGPVSDFVYRQAGNKVKVSALDCGSLDIFTEILQKNPIVIAAFTMKGCGHCEKMKPEFIEAASRSAVPFVTLDAKVAGDEMLRGLQIEGFPTIVRFEGGKAARKFEKLPRTADNFVSFGGAQV